MFAVSMGIFASVIAVVALGAVALLTSSVAAHMRAWESRIQEMQIHVKAIQSMASTSTPAAIKAELDDLRAALDVSRASLRKELGSLWGRVGGAAKPNGAPTTFHAANDDDFAAMLALQSAPPVEPK